MLGTRPPFSVAREKVEVGDGYDFDPAVHAEREQIAVPRNKGIHRSDDGDGNDVIVIRIPAGAGNLDRRYHLGDRLELGSHRRSPIACPPTGLHQHTLKLAEDRGTDDQQVITTEDVLEEASRAPTKVECRNQHIGVKDNPHSACQLAAREATTRLHRSSDCVFSQGAGRRSFFSIRKKLVPSSASLRILAKRFAQKFAARATLLVRQTIDLDRELWRQGDRHGPSRSHNGR